MKRATSTWGSMQRTGIWRNRIAKIKTRTEKRQQMRQQQQQSHEKHTKQPNNGEQHLRKKVSAENWQRGCQRTRDNQRTKNERKKITIRKGTLGAVTMRMGAMFIATKFYCNCFVIIIICWRWSWSFAMAVCLRKLLMMILCLFFSDAILSSGGCIIFRYSTIIATLSAPLSTSLFVGAKKIQSPNSIFLSFSHHTCHSTSSRGYAALFCTKFQANILYSESV